MSWNKGNASPEENPLHYLGCRALAEVIDGNHLAKIIARHDHHLFEAIGGGTRALAEDAIHQVARLKIHIWSSNTFTVAFMETGHMGCSKRNAVDKAELERGITIASGRAVAGFIMAEKLEWDYMQAGEPGVDLTNQVIPAERHTVAGELEKMKKQQALRDSLSANPPGPFKDEEQAREWLDRREERNISESTGYRFRY